jgi:hypothetical protein
MAKRIDRTNHNGFFEKLAGTPGLGSARAKEAAALKTSSELQGDCSNQTRKHAVFGR